MSAPPVPTAPGPGRLASTSPLGHLRAGAFAVVIVLFLGTVVLPLLVTGFAQVVTPASANGSLVHGPNGTVVGSILVGQNLSVPYLFWPRISSTDYEMVLGSPTPPGPADPALVAELTYYLQLYRNYTVNGTNGSLPGALSQWILTDSGSGVDPDLSPEDALVQIPRVALATHLSQAELMLLVNQHIQGAPFGLPGPRFVNVLQLDIALEETPGFSHVP